MFAIEIGEDLRFISFVMQLKTEHVLNASRRCSARVFPPNVRR